MIICDGCGKRVNQAPWEEGHYKVALEIASPHTDYRGKAFPVLRLNHLCRPCFETVYASIEMIIGVCRDMGKNE